MSVINFVQVKSTKIPIERVSNAVKVAATDRIQNLGIIVHFVYRNHSLFLKLHKIKTNKKYLFKNKKIMKPKSNKRFLLIPASIFPSAASWGNWGSPATNLYQPHSMSHVTPSHVTPHLSSYPHYA